MNRLLVSTAVVLMLGVGTAVGQPPQMIAYQGLLTDETGSPVSDGTYSLTFRIYDDLTGGTELWSETQADVAVSGGCFRALIGSVTPITLDFDVPCCLEVQVGTETPQTPRIELASVPYSFMAMDADQVDGFDAEATPTANTLLPLDATGMFPQSAIPSIPPSGPAGGDLTGTYPNPAIAADAVTSGKIQDAEVKTADIEDNAVTAAKVLPDILSTVDGVGNDGGDIDLVAGANITITPDDAANTITIDAVTGEGDITSVWPADATLTGGADAGDVTLAVANPLELQGSSDGVIKGTCTWSGDYGYLGRSHCGAYGYSGTDHGVYGRSVNGNGVYGRNDNGNCGKLGTGDYGVYGEHNGGNYGYFGSSTYGAYGQHGAGNRGYLGGSMRGVGAYSDDNDTYAYLAGEKALYAQNPTGHAGYFYGDVHVTGTVSKGGGSFLIDHPLDPENKLLRHNFVESPENLLIYRGRTQLDEQGEATIGLPDYFVALTNETEATVTLTPVGRPFLTGYEWELGHGSFKVYGESRREVSWVVYVDRDDPVIRQLARPVEEEKGPDNRLCERGKLLYPTAYGYPESRGATYEEDRAEIEGIKQEEAAHAERVERDRRRLREIHRTEMGEQGTRGVLPIAPQR